MLVRSDLIGRADLALVLQKTEAGSGRHSATRRSASATCPKTFTDGQLSAIKTALEDGTPGKKAVDVRFSIPLFRRRAFLEFLAGWERRSPERRSQDREKHALLTVANAGAFAFIFLLLIPAFMGTGHILTLYLGMPLYRFFAQ